MIDFIIILVIYSCCGIVYGLLKGFDLIEDREFFPVFIFIWPVLWIGGF